MNKSTYNTVVSISRVYTSDITVFPHHAECCVKGIDYKMPVSRMFIKIFQV